MNDCGDSSRISKQVLLCKATCSQARGLLGSHNYCQNFWRRTPTTVTKIVSRLRAMVDPIM
jgi:hypothetical protein